MKFNVPYGHKPERFSQSYITKITNQIKYVEYAAKLNDWEFKCQDFRVTLEDLSSQDFIYCDPPYIGRHVDYFDSWNEIDETDLNALLSKTSAKFIMSTWHNNQYRTNEYLEKLWKIFHIITKKHFYHVGAKEENRSEMIEALIMNYTPVLNEPIFVQKEDYKYAELFG